MKVQVSNNIDLEIVKFIQNNLVVALPTGNTPIGMYQELIKRSKQGLIDWRTVKIYMLDSYYPQNQNDPESFYTYIKQHLLSKIILPKENFNILNSEAIDPNKEGKDYDEKIKQEGGLDLAILGIGENGHIGFNEPGSSVDSLTRLVQLSDVTKKINKIEFNQALTMGIQTIFQSKRVIVLAKGENKAEAVKQAIEGKQTVNCPASLLQNHPDISYYLDNEASSRLSNHY